MKTNRWILFLVLMVSPLIAQERREMTVEWIYSDEGEEPAKLPQFAWTTQEELLLLDTRRPKVEQTLERVKLATGERSPAVDRSAALASLKPLLGDQDIPDMMPWPDSIDQAGRTAVYCFAGDLFALDLATSRFERLTPTGAKESAPRLSPDGRKVAFVRENDLYFYELRTKTETRLTRDGGPALLNGTFSWVYWEEIFDHDEASFWWSEDSNAIAFFRTDESMVSMISFPDFTPAVPRILTQRYPKAGEANPSVRLGIVDVGSGRTTWMDTREAPYEYILGVKWLPDSRRVAVQTTNRMQNRLDLCLVDRASGKATPVLTEKDNAWVNQRELHFMEGGKKLLISSERDGHTHLYRYTTEGELVNRVTAGNWSVRGTGDFYGASLGSAFVNETQGYVYFTALEKSPAERHLYRIRLDGSGMERLTREEGVHQVSFSPDRRYYLDVHSDRKTLPSLSLYDATGARRAVLAPPRNELIAPFDFQYAELLTIPASDGFPLPARILKPKGFDPSRKHPVILYVYCGPSAPTVKDAWVYSFFAGNTYFDQILVRQGYVVASIDNRSATGISKELENSVVNRVWSDGELEDLLAGVRWLKAQPWVDPERLGIWGWSGGGTSTLLALTRSHEFKAGIAIAPVTDWHYYDTKFTETYMRSPSDNPEGYAHTSLVERAKDLHGRLLLVFGTYDDNVHPQNSLHFVDELVKAGKPVDLMVYPMRKHLIEDRPARIHLFNKMLEFWKLYL